MVLHIISVGGSLIVPDEIDVSFIKEFKDLILKRVEKGDRFILVCGGGKICRKYQKALDDLSDLGDLGDLDGDNNEDKDWLGISVTRLNAEFIRLVFKDIAYKNVVENPNFKIEFDSNGGGKDGSRNGSSDEKKVLVACGWKPGCSTDKNAVLLAENFKAKSIINLSNVDYVYSEDPKKNPNAKKLKEISWSDFKKLVGDKWNPGLNMPFDPIASKEASNLGLKVAIINGKNLKSLNRFLDEKEFKGTLIR